MSWDDEDYTPNQWDDEDEDDVADAWDAEPVKKPAPVKKPEKKKEVWVDETLSDDEAEAERRKKKQLESDMQHATDLFGVDDLDLKDLALTTPVSAGKYETTNPKTVEDFREFANWIANDLDDRLKKSPHHREFLKILMDKLTKDYDEVDLRGVASHFTARAHEKVQAQKTKKKKGKTGKKSRGGDDATYDMVEDEYSSFF